MAMQDTVTLIGDIGGNENNDEAAFTTKLARPLNLPGQWRASIMDISYPHLWTTIHRDLTFAVMFPSHLGVNNYDHNSILSTVQPNPNSAANYFVATKRPEFLSKAESNLFNELRYINFPDPEARYAVLTDTIIEGEHIDPELIVEQISSKIVSLFRQHFPNVSPEEYENPVTYNPVTRRVTFKNFHGSRYLIVAPSDGSIISLLGHRARSFKIPTLDSELEVLPVETVARALSPRRQQNPLKPIQKVNLRTLDNVFVYSDIVEQSLIGESQASFLGYFPIKSTFGETGYWCFNPPYDYKVIQSCIDTISIKLAKMNGELFPFKNGQIIIRLLFKRVG